MQELSLQQATADVSSIEGYNTAAATAQSAGQTATSEEDLADTLLDDGNQSEWEARADFIRRLSMLPRDSFLELGMANGAQAEWEARALWSLDSERASQEQPLHTSSSGLLADGPLDPFTADSLDALDQAGAAVQQPLSAKAAAAAAVQRALSNIHFIATGSQQARAAAAAAGAAAAAASQASESDNASQLQPGSASVSDAHTAGASLSEAAAGDSRNVLTAMSADVDVKAGRSLDSTSVSTPLYSSSLADSANVPWAMSTLHDDETPLSVNNGICQDVGDVAAAPSGSMVESMHRELGGLSQKPEVDLSTDTEQPQLGMAEMSSSAGQAANEQKADSGQQADDGQHVANRQQADEESRVQPAASGSQAVLDFEPLPLQHLLGPSLLEQQPQPEPQAALSMAQQPAFEEMQVQGASLQSQFDPPDSNFGQQGTVANQTAAGLSCTGSVQSDEHADRLQPACLAATSHGNGGDDLLTSQGFAVPSWQGLPSFEPTSSVLDSMSVKQVNHFALQR